MTGLRARAWFGGLLLATALAPAAAQTSAPTTQPLTRSGREIYAEFRAGLADPECPANGGSARWRQHFANAPKRMATEGDDVLPLFGYVVDALRAEHLPTEYALIPFVESGYRPGARSQGGPAGLWQFIALTARNHDVAVRAGYDGRLSPIDSTRAAVRYLKTLHGMYCSTPKNENGISSSPKITEAIQPEVLSRSFCSILEAGLVREPRSVAACPGGCPGLAAGHRAGKEKAPFRALFLWN